MIPGPDIVIACPHCGSLARIPTISSGNTFGASVWTDGKMVAPMFPDTIEIARCQKCLGFYWIEDAREIGEVPITGYESDADNINPDWLSAPSVEELDEKQYWEALSSDVAEGVEREARLRFLAWWKANDKYRVKDGTNFSQSDPALDNARKLFDLLSEKDEEEENLLFRAELLRQLGKFKESIRELERVQDPGYSDAVTRIRELAKEGDSQLRLLYGA